MSTELKPFETTRTGSVFVTRFWGGEDETCFQFTPSNTTSPYGGYFQLTMAEMEEFRQALHDLLVDRYPTSE